MSPFSPIDVAPDTGFVRVAFAGDGTQTGQESPVSGMDKKARATLRSTAHYHGLRRDARSYYRTQPATRIAQPASHE